MLTRTTDLILNSWGVYRRHWRHFLPFLLLLAASGFLVFLSGYLGIEIELHLRTNYLINDIIILLIYIVSLIFSVWVTISLTQTADLALKNQPVENWKNSLLNNTRLIIPVIINLILVTLIVAVGSLLLIIPGIIFFVWYNFSSYEIILDNISWKKALNSSKKLVIGRWWAIAIRIFLIIAFYTIISALIQFMITNILGLIPNISEITLAIFQNTLISITNLILTPPLITSLVGLYISAKENPITQN